ncbi:MAG: NUDIX pyrophosphatase [Ignavibacteria bacterium]|nr:NUDIX pyrophosphatase [Ignavibacteria bacterium]
MSQILSRFIECIVFKNHTFDPKFLVLKRSDDAKVHPGIWQIVTAKIDEGEKAYDTARREVKEETGLEPRELYVAPSINHFYNYMDDSINLVPVFIAEVDSEDVKISDEHSEFEWLSYDEALGRIHWVSQKKMVKEAFEHIKSKELYKTLKKII